MVTEQEEGRSGNGAGSYANVLTMEYKSMVDMFSPVETPAGPAVPLDSPLSVNVREAIQWARANGVAEMTLPSGHRFVLRPPVPESVPTMADLKEKLATIPKERFVVGGYDAEMLFAASPRPYVPDSADPLPQSIPPSK